MCRVHVVTTLIVLGHVALCAQKPHLTCDLSNTPSARIGERELALRTNEVPRSDSDAVRFPRDNSYLDIGPDPALGLASKDSFSVCVRIRTQRGSFCTPLMCREGGAVNYSFVLGRRTGTLSFEIWSWKSDRAISTTRIDDGKWHEVVGAYDATSRTMGILVDGVVESLVRVGTEYRPSARPMLRLGNNIGSHQPFAGTLGGVRIDRGVPKAFADAVGVLARFTVMERGRTDAMFEKWLVRMRAPRAPTAKSRADWRTKAAATRAKLQSALGLLPPPYAPKGFDAREATDFATYRPTLPLAIRRGGTLSRGDYAVTRIYWQTVRGYFASGYLYEPAGSHAERSLPAVLCPHGHFRDGARHPVIQSRCITLARNGYVVLAVDSVHVTDDPIGLSPLSLMTWNNLRGLELLRGLPPVDPARIGCTGASGGGQQTFYLTGLRTGLAAVVPAVMVCYFEEILLSSGVHCRCNFTPGVMRFADEPLLSACFAPKPQLFLSVTGDWTKNFPQKGFPEVRSIYDHFDAREAVASRQWNTHHDYNRDMRNAMYAFFGRHLKKQESPPAELEPKGIRTENRNALIALDLRGVPRDLEAVKREFRGRLSARAPDRAALLERFGGDLGDVRLVSKGDTFRWKGYEVRRFVLELQSGIALPLIALGPKREPARVVVLLHPDGKVAMVHRHGRLLRTLLERGVAVCLADIRYSGELDRAHSWREPYGKIFGRDVGVAAATDIAHVLSVVSSSLMRVKPQRVSLVAFGGFGAPALYAVAIHGGCSDLVAPELGPTYATTDRSPKIAGILRVADLPAAAVLLPEGTRLWAGACPFPVPSQNTQITPLDPARIVELISK